MSGRRASNPGRAGGAAGFTLVELLVALALSLLVVGGALRLFTAFRRGHDRQVEAVDLRQRAGYCLDTIARDLRAAGRGWRAVDPDTVLASRDNGGPIAGTDTLEVRYVAGLVEATIGTAPPSLTLASLDWDGDGHDDLEPRDFNGGTEVAIAVGEGPFEERVEVVTAVDLAGRTLFLEPPGVAGSYDRPMAGEVRHVVYTVDRAADGTPCLYREVVRLRADGSRASRRQQLATGIDDLQVRFGGVPPAADDLAAVGAARVTAVEVSVVARSEAEILADPAPFPRTQDSTRAPAADRRLRRAYEVTVSLRN